MAEGSKKDRSEKLDGSKEKVNQKIDQKKHKEDHDKKRRHRHKEMSKVMRDGIKTTVSSKHKRSEHQKNRVEQYKRLQRAKKKVQRPKKEEHEVEKKVQRPKKEEHEVEKKVQRSKKDEHEVKKKNHKPKQEDRKAKKEVHSSKKKEHKGKKEVHSLKKKEPKTKKEIHRKSDLPDEFVEDQETVVEREVRQKDEKKEAFYEEMKGDVLKDGAVHEEQIKREKDEPVFETIVDDKEDVGALSSDTEKLHEGHDVVEGKKKTNSNGSNNQKGQRKHNRKDKAVERRNKDSELGKDDFNEDQPFDELSTEGDDNLEDLFAEDFSEENKLSDDSAVVEHLEPKTNEQRLEEKEKKKKSYLDVLQEEAKKFEEMEAQRKSTETMDPIVSTESSEDVLAVDDSDDGSNDDWLNFVNESAVAEKSDVDNQSGVYADAAHRNIGHQKNGEVSKQGQVLNDELGVVGSDEKVGQSGLVDSGSFTKLSNGSHSGNRDELYKSKGVVGGEGGIRHKAELFGGGNIDVEGASEKMSGEEGGGGAGVQYEGDLHKGVLEKSSTEVVSEKIIDNTVNTGRSKINDVLDESKKSGSKKFFDELKNVLGQAGFSMESLRGGCIVLVFILIFGFGFWFDWHKSVWRFVSGINPFGGNSNGQEEKLKNDEFTYKWSVKSADFFGQELYGESPLPDSIRSGFLFGETISLKGKSSHSGIEVGLVFGETDHVPESQRFAYLVETVGALRNIYLTDLYKLLDTAENRPVALEKYLTQLKEMQQKGLELEEEIQGKVEELKQLFESITKEKKDKENEFFEYMDDFDGVRSDLALAEFIKLRKEQDELRSNHNALSRLIKEYEKILLRIDRRIQSIELNRNALIQGIKITPIEGDNLGLIEKAEKEK